MNALLRGLRQLGGHAVLYLSLLILGLMLLGATALMALLVPLSFNPVRHRARCRRITAQTFRAYLGFLRLIGVLQIDLSALDALRSAGPLVIAPNHPCLLDAVFMLSRLPGAVCVMKASLWDNFFLGAGARMSGYIRNDVPLQMVRLSVDSLRQGSQLLMFPEGTRTVRDPIDPLKGAFALIAKKSAVPIQMVFIETHSPFLRKGWPLWRKPPFPLVYRVRLGPRLSAQAPVEATMAELSRVFNQELVRPRPAPSRSRAGATRTVDEPIDVAQFPDNRGSL